MKSVISNEIKEDIKFWWKTNMLNCKINEKVINKLKELILHEFIHYKIVKTSARTIELVLSLGKSEDDIGCFYYEAYCKYTYPYKFNLPKYYPKFVFIEFKHFLFDFIYDIFKFAIFTTFKYRLFKFLKVLISFKVRS